MAKRKKVKKGTEAQRHTGTERKIDSRLRGNDKGGGARAALQKMAQRKPEREKTETKENVGKKVREHVGFLVELNKLQATLLVTLSSLAYKIVYRRKK